MGRALDARAPSPQGLLMLGAGQPPREGQWGSPCGVTYSVETPGEY